MSSRAHAPTHPLDAAARAYALLGRIGELPHASLPDGSPRECLRALAEHERHLHELGALLQELDAVRHELEHAEPADEAAAARAALDDVLRPVEAAARGLLARAEELASRRRALLAVLEGGAA